MLLGQILLRRKKISSDLLEQQLALLEERNKKLGELLVEQALITSKDLEAALQEQDYRRRGLWIID